MSKVSTAVEMILSSMKTNECVLWPTESGTSAYGTVRGPSKMLRVNDRAQARIGTHVLACRMAHGPPPDQGMQVRHSCHTPLCLNPRHLSWGTPRQNSEDRQERTTHCPNGHEYTPDNIYIQPSNPSVRQCFICRKKRQRKADAKRPQRQRRRWGSKVDTVSTSEDHQQGEQPS